MKQNAQQLDRPPQDLFNGAQTFINQGTNGRWRDVLTEENSSCIPPPSPAS